MDRKLERRQTIYAEHTTGKNGKAVHTGGFTIDSESKRQDFLHFALRSFVVGPPSTSGSLYRGQSYMESNDA